MRNAIINTFVDKCVRKSIYTGKRRAAPCGDTVRPLLVVTYRSLFSSCRMKNVRINFRIRGQLAPFPWKSFLIHSSPPFFWFQLPCISRPCEAEEPPKEGAPDQLSASPFLPLNGAGGQFLVPPCKYRSVARPCPPCYARKMGKYTVQLDDIRVRHLWRPDLTDNLREGVRRRRTRPCPGAALGVQRLPVSFRRFRLGAS